MNDYSLLHVKPRTIRNVYPAQNANFAWLVRLIPRRRPRRPTRLSSATWSSSPSLSAPSGTSLSGFRQILDLFCDFFSRFFCGFSTLVKYNLKEQVLVKCGLGEVFLGQM